MNKPNTALRDSLKKILHIYRNKTDQNRDKYEVGYPDEYDGVLDEAINSLLKIIQDNQEKESDE